MVFCCNTNCRCIMGNLFCCAGESGDIRNRFSDAATHKSDYHSETTFNETTVITNNGSFRVNASKPEQGPDEVVTEEPTKFKDPQPHVIGGVPSNEPSSSPSLRPPPLSNPDILADLNDTKTTQNNDQSRGNGVESSASSIAKQRNEGEPAAEERQECWDTRHVKQESANDLKDGQLENGDLQRPESLVEACLPPLTTKELISDQRTQHAPNINKIKHQNTRENSINVKWDFSSSEDVCDAIVHESRFDDVAERLKGDINERLVEIVVQSDKDGLTLPVVTYKEDEVETQDDYYSPTYPTGNQSDYGDQGYQYSHNLMLSPVLSPSESWGNRTLSDTHLVRMSAASQHEQHLLHRSKELEKLTDVPDDDSPYDAESELNEKCKKGNC